MSTQFTLTNQRYQQQQLQQHRRFCIDDAFEEETDEAIKVYGATTPTTTTINIPQENTNNTQNNRNLYKLTNDNQSRDSDSLIQDDYNGSDYFYDNLSGDFINQYSTTQTTTQATTSCLKHPKVRENWRMVLAALLLLLIGIGLLICSIYYLHDIKNNGLQGYVFLIVGFICFIPGAYHVVYIYLAAIGKRGYHFHNLPLFT